MIRLVLERPGLVPVLMAFNQPVVVVGRGTGGDGGPEVDWRVPFADVSRRQCRFSQVADRTYVEGLSERNPTRVNQRPIRGLTRLHPGDLVAFGGCTIRLAGEDLGPRPPEVRRSAAPRPPAPAALQTEEAVSEDMSSILERASRWAAHGQAPELLLGGAELRRGRAWLRGGAELGEAGALARRYVEASLRARRARGQRAAVIGAAVVAAVAGGSAAGREILGPWAIERVVAAGRPFEDGCRRPALIDAEEVLQAARREDGDVGLLMSGYALLVAERGGCAAVSRAEAAVREALAGRRARVVGRHAGPVRALAVRDDGRVIASADAAGPVRLWDGAGGPPVELAGDGGATELLAFGGDGRWLVAGGAAGELRVWDLRGYPQVEPPLQLVGHRGAIAAAAFDAAGALLATSDRRGVLKLWDMSGETAGTEVGEQAVAAGAVLDMTFGAGRLFGRAGGRVHAWRVHPPGAARRLGALEVLPSTAAVTAVAVVGERVVAGDADGAVVVWRAGRGGWTGRAAARHRGPVARVRAVAGRAAAVSLGRDGGLLLVDLAAPLRRDGTPLVHGFAPLASAVDDLVVETAGRRALTLGGELAVWDILERRAEPLARLGEQTAAVTAVAGAGAWAVTGGEDGVVRAWDLRADGGSAGAYALTDHPAEVVSLAFAGGGAALASAGRDAAVRVWRVDRDGVPAPQGVLRPARAVERVALSDDGRWLAGASGRALHVWDLEDLAREPTELVGHVEAIREFAFAGGGWLVSVDLVGEIHFWRVTPAGVEASSRRTSLPRGVWALATAGEHLAIGTGASDDSSGRTYAWPLGAAWSEDALVAEHARPVTALAFSADGSRLASGSADGGVRTASLVEGRWRAARPYDHGQSVRALAFAGAGEGAEPAALAIGGAHGLVAIHAPEAGGAQRRFTAHAAAITGLTFAGDDARLVTASQDGELKLWRLGEDGEQALSLAGHHGPIFELQADHAGRVVVTAGDDAALRVWPLEPPALMRLACLLAGRDLEPEAWRRALPTRRPEPLCAGAGW